MAFIFHVIIIKSGGWSDMDDLDVDASIEDISKRSTTKSSLKQFTDVIELARIRAQVKRLEADLEQAK